MASERTDELYKVLLGKGYPKELCTEIAYKNMRYRLYSYPDVGVFVSLQQSKNRRSDR